MKVHETRKKLGTKLQSVASLYVLFNLVSRAVYGDNAIDKSYPLAAACNASDQRLSVVNPAVGGESPPDTVMYEVSCVAGNKVDAAYAVKSLSNVIPHSMGHSVSTAHRHHGHSQSYKHRPEPPPPPVSKPDALKSHVMRLLKRSKSHTPATRVAEVQGDARAFDRRTVFSRPVADEQRRRRNSAERRRSADKRVMVTIVDGLPVVVTGRGEMQPQPPPPPPPHHHPPPVTHHRHTHRDKVAATSPDDKR
ncbi:unnamed protein product, partial [Iphiclides podalirius]